ncbi:hypothetical protein [Rhodovulum sp. FJ3]|uniref:hypothetical protein n=1 Tax=Rhodovulum sp. FJ3 TaxID=3079053 RepID=UPI00293DB6ED|nr:hypothetical protein [Rhodovulum sp. FJ3]MDV4166482.1 hypothetical protein [Rhodovulum sp. FJ3]
MNDMTTRRFGGFVSAVQDAQKFVRANDASLRCILRIAGGDYGEDLLRETRRIFEEEDMPDVSQLGRLFRAMRVILMEAAHLPGDQLAALRWHGARLSDLSFRLPA